jgi:hypothetical protein
LFAEGKWGKETVVNDALKLLQLKNQYHEI